MIEFMNFETTKFPNFGSGWISRFSALWRRDIGSVLDAFSDLAVRPARLAGYFGRYLGLLLRSLGTVFRTALLAVLHALGVEHAAQDVVAHARQVLDTTATDHHHRVLLQIVALTRNVADDL